MGREALSLCETTDACLLPEGTSCTPRRVLGFFEIDTGVAMTFFLGLRFRFRFLMRDSFRQHVFN